MTLQGKSLGGRIGGLTTIARHGARNVAARARAGMWEKFLDEVDPDRVLDPDERHERALRARRAHMTRMAAKSAAVRASRKPQKPLCTCAEPHHH